MPGRGPLVVELLFCYALGELYIEDMDGVIHGFDRHFIIV
jgi:hypothetical protein